MAEPTPKSSFGSVTVSHIAPPLPDTAAAAYNIHMSFEEALKLYFGLSQILGKLNGYKHSTTLGKRAAVNLCLYSKKNRITINEGRLKKPAVPTDSTANAAPEDGEGSEE